MGGMSEANDSKVNLDVPEHLEYSDEHVWVDSSVEPAMVGVTEYATEQFGELVYIDLPEVGTQVEAGDEVADSNPPRRSPRWSRRWLAPSATSTTRLRTIRAL